MTVNHFDVATPREWTLEVSYVLVRLGVDGGLTWLRYPQRAAQGGYQQQGRLVLVFGRRDQGHSCCTCM